MDITLVAICLKAALVNTNVLTQNQLIWDSGSRLVTSDGEKNPEIIEGSLLFYCRASIAISYPALVGIVYKNHV